MPGREEALNRASAYKNFRDDPEFQRWSEEQSQRAQAATGGALATAGLLAPVLDGKQYYAADQAERSVALADAGAGDLDQTLRQRYLNQGPYALVTDDAFDKVNAYVPPGQSGFEPSDLSQAGGFGQILQEGKDANPDLQRQITVSPGPQPRRLSYEGLNADDLGETGQKGYIWANPEQPQFGYAAGNFNRGKQPSRNPAVNLLAVNMPADQQRRFMTTGEVVKDDTFVTDRGWGQRGFESGDVMFPKENILGRAEVTAADIYTRMQDLGLSHELGDFERDPGKAFKELADSYAEAMKTTPAAALQDLATPVPALGVSERKAGSLPVREQFYLAGATPEAVRRSGIGTVYIGADHPAAAVRLPEERRLFLESADDRRWNVTQHFEVNPSLVNPKNGPGAFLRRQSGAGVLSGLSLAMDPQINQALQRGDYSQAALVGGTGIAAGAVGEAAAKRGLAELAKRGVTAPLRMAAAVSAPLAAIPLAATAERSTPMTRAQVQRDRRDNPANYGAQGPSANPQLRRAEAARLRGGRWKIGGFTVPELGISEAGGLFFR